jgi:hypothetical protein
LFLLNHLFIITSTNFFFIFFPFSSAFAILVSKIIELKQKTVIQFENLISSLVKNINKNSKKTRSKMWDDRVKKDDLEIT